MALMTPPLNFSLVLLKIGYAMFLQNDRDILACRFFENVMQLTQQISRGGGGNLILFMVRGRAIF